MAERKNPETNTGHDTFPHTAAAQISKSKEGPLSYITTQSGKSAIISSIRQNGAAQSNAISCHATQDGKITTLCVYFSEEALKKKTGLCPFTLCPVLTDEAEV